MKKTLHALALCALAAGVHAQYGTGTDGPLTVAGTTLLLPVYGITQAALASPGATSFDVSFPGGTPPSVGSEILLYITALGDPNVGLWETALVSGTTLVSGLVYTVDVASPLAGAYPAFTYVQVVPNYTDVTVGPSGVLQGGILFFRASGTVDIQGIATSTGRGYVGGDSGAFMPVQGGSPLSGGGSGTAENSGGGGAGEDATIPPGGGGGSHATVGSDGEITISSGLPTTPGSGGTTLRGSADLSAGLFAGCGGGTGGVGTLGSRAGGGNGGGIVWIAAQALAISGTLEADGEAGEDGTGSVIDTTGGGGGGAGGTVWLQTCTLSGSGTVSALGGFGGLAGTGTTTTGFGGDGGDGRVRIDSPLSGPGSFLVNAGSAFYGTPSCVSAVGNWSMY